MKQFKHKSIYLIALLVITSLACGQLTVAVETPTPTIDAISEIVQATLTAMHNNQNQVNESNRDYLLSGDRQTGATLPNYLSGLLYRSVDGENYWIVGENGQTIWLTDQMISSGLSPDGAKALFSIHNDNYTNEDLALLNLATGEVQQLTNTPDTLEGSPQWWPAKPNLIVFNYMTFEQLGPWAGYIGIYNLETDEYIALGEESASNNAFSLSPDGQYILFDGGANPSLYHVEKGFEPIDLGLYDLESGTQNPELPKDEGYNFFRSFDWSPDGQKIAMYAGNKHTGQRAVIIIDLVNQTTKILHEYKDTVGASRGIPLVKWSPNGEWLAAVTQGEIDRSQNGIVMWIMSSDGTQKQAYPYGADPYWSPDSQRVLFTQWPTPGTGGGSYWEDAHINVVEIGIWTPLEIEELLGSLIVDWGKIP